MRCLGPGRSLGEVITLARRPSGVRGCPLLSLGVARNVALFPCCVGVLIR